MKTPFLGCAYYPEDWDESEIGYDIEKMKVAGITCARIGEFAWRKMEPDHGKFDFGWLHHVVDELGKAGIAVVMGTPTATPPIWLSKEYPDIMKQNVDGTRVKHGGRRHCCSNNPHYLDACDRIVHEMGREFGKDKNIIGWQIDNEIYTGDTGCTCEYCMKNYHDRLADEYGTVDELNRRWNLNLFSQAYDSFEQIPAGYGAWHNPHIIYEWKMAHHDADRLFVHRQAEILRQYTTAPIGTDMMPLNGLDYEAVTEPLDIVQFNHYNTPENLNDAVFWFDYLRTLKDRPFWNTETATTWNGSASIRQFLKPEGYCRLNSWLPVALGGEANMYWLWRQHWAGHELLHGSVLSPEGRPAHVFGEIQQTAREFELASDFIDSTKVKAEVALHYTSKSWNLFEQQPIVDGNNYTGAVCGKFHHAIRRMGVCVDVIGANKSLDAYKVLVSPLMMTLEIGDLSDRIRTWVENGGVWIVGPMSDIRNSIGAHYTDRAMGMLEEMLGIRQDYNIPTDGNYLKAEWTDGEPLECIKWTECYTNPADGEALASITAGHSALKGECVIGRYAYGKGKVIICGTFPNEDSIRKLVDIALTDAGVRKYDICGDAVVIPREGNGQRGIIVCETGFAEATITLDTPVTDILTGRRYDAGKMPLDPYGVYVLAEL